MTDKKLKGLDALRKKVKKRAAEAEESAAAPQPEVDAEEAEAEAEEAEAEEAAPEAPEVAAEAPEAEAAAPPVAAPKAKAKAKPKPAPKPAKVRSGPSGVGDVGQWAQVHTGLTIFFFGVILAICESALSFISSTAPDAGLSGLSSMVNALAFLAMTAGVVMCMRLPTNWPGRSAALIAAPCAAAALVASLLYTFTGSPFMRLLALAAGAGAWLAFLWALRSLAKSFANHSGWWFSTTSFVLMAIAYPALVLSQIFVVSWLGAFPDAMVLNLPVKNDPTSLLPAQLTAVLAKQGLAMLIAVFAVAVQFAALLFFVLPGARSIRDSVAPAGERGYDPDYEGTAEKEEGIRKKSAWVAGVLGFGGLAALILMVFIGVAGLSAECTENPDDAFCVALAEAGGMGAMFIFVLVLAGLAAIEVVERRMRKGTAPAKANAGFVVAGFTLGVAGLCLLLLFALQSLGSECDVADTVRPQHCGEWKGPAGWEIPAVIALLAMFVTAMALSMLRAIRKAKVDQQPNAVLGFMKTGGLGLTVSAVSLGMTGLLLALFLTQQWLSKVCEPPVGPDAPKVCADWPGPAGWESIVVLILLALFAMAMIVSLLGAFKKPKPAKAPAPPAPPAAPPPKPA